jgi:hypothetical protein
MAIKNNAYNNFVAEAPKVPVRYNKSKSDLRRVTSISPVDEDSAARLKKPVSKVPKVQKPMVPSGIQVRPNTNGGYFYQKRQTQLNNNGISEN